MLSLLSFFTAAAPPAANVGKPIVVVGSVNADIVVEINRMPLTGETIGARVTDTGKMFGGGKGANQAVAAAQLGHPTKFVGSFGNDQNAVALRKMLLDKSVDTSLCLESSVPNGQVRLSSVFPLAQPSASE
jgi:ribokinase